MTADATQLEELGARTELLFTQDARRRLLRARETAAPLAPRFYFARNTPARNALRDIAGAGGASGSLGLGNVWRFRADLPRWAVVELARLAGKERPMPGFEGAEHSSQPPPPERVEAFRRVLREHAEIKGEYRGPTFRFPAILPDCQTLEDDTELVHLDARREADLALLLASRDAGELDLSDLATPSPLSPQTDCFAIVRAGELVSACWTSRFLPGVAAEAGVDTRASQRGRGFAARVVSAWARALRENGAEPLYSTEWTNAASRGVARKLGLILWGEDLHFQ